MLDTRVARVGQMEDGWQVETRGGDDSSVLRADRLVVATDGPAAWDLLAPVSGECWPQRTVRPRDPVWPW